MLKSSEDGKGDRMTQVVSPEGQINGKAEE